MTGKKPSLDELEQQQQQQRQTPTAADSAGPDVPTTSSHHQNQPPAEAETESSLSLPGLSLSRQTLAILAVVALVALYLHHRSQQPSSVHAAAQMDRAVNDDLPNEIDATPDVVDDEEEADPNGRITVPNDPSDPLAGDAAVLDELRRRGRLNGGGD